MGLLEWKKSWFFRCFCPLTAALGLWPFDGRSPGMLLQPLAGIMTVAALATALAEAVRREVARRTEARLLAQRGELAQSSYEVLRRQYRQVMMLRHDMMKHFQVLRQTTTDEKAAAYLDELIGENEKIRPLVQSGNEMLDVISNGKLSAAAASGAERPYIKLDFRVKEHFFVFSCENSTTLQYIQKENAPGRGLGLKIIKQIAAQYDDLLETEYGADYYNVKLAIPLD